MKCTQAASPERWFIRVSSFLMVHWLRFSKKSATGRSAPKPSTTLKFLIGSLGSIVFPITSILNQTNFVRRSVVASMVWRKAIIHEHDFQWDLLWWLISIPLYLFGCIYFKTYEIRTSPLLLHFSRVLDLKLFRTIGIISLWFTCRGIVLTLLIQHQDMHKGMRPYGHWLRYFLFYGPEDDFSRINPYIAVQSNNVNKFFLFRRT